MEVYLGKAGLEHTLESVILAAGRGQRMSDIAKPFYKPLLEINGIPLLVHAVEYASAAGSNRVTVVVSPHNVDDVEQVLSAYMPWVQLAIQEEPLGPGYAALIGLSEVVDKQTMLLMSDNIMDSGIVASMATRCMVDDQDAIGIRTVSRSQASRFTRVRQKSTYVYEYVEGTDVLDRDVWPGTEDKVKVWCGPLIFKTENAVDALNAASRAADLQNGELKIGPHLNNILRDAPILVDVHAMDVGIPSEYQQVRQ